MKSRLTHPCPMGFVQQPRPYVNCVDYKTAFSERIHPQFGLAIRGKFVIIHSSPNQSSSGLDFVSGANQITNTPIK